MRYGDLQFIDIIIFAVITIFLIIRLKNILGSRGNLKKDNIADLKTKEQNIEQKPDNQHIPELSENISKLEKAYEVLENFAPSIKFLWSKFSSTSYAYSSLLMFSLNSGMC